MNEPRPRLHVVTNNHFDLTWRRCWERRFTWQGRTYASYSDLEQWYIEDNLALTAAYPECRFEVESVAVLRQFLRRCPDRRAEIAALVQAGRFTVAGSGGNIVDAVLVRGESWFATPGAAWYGVPYGMIARPEYAPAYGWSAASGDHPAVEWAGVQGAEFSVAVFDAGTPSYRIRRGVIEVSLLRAPAVPTFLHEPLFYSMTGFDGMRDAGRHVFGHALTAYDRPFAQSTVVHDAEAFNQPFAARPGRIEPWPAPQVTGEGVRLGAVTWQEGRLLLRLVECGGAGALATIRLPAGLTRAEQSDLRGRHREALPVTAGAVQLVLKPWEIATVLLSGVAGTP